MSSIASGRGFTFTNRETVLRPLDLILRFRARNSTVVTVPDSVAMKHVA